MGLPPNLNLITNRTAKLPGDWKQQTTVQSQQTHTAHVPNKNEAAYARELDALKAVGLIKDYAFESMKLWLLGERTWYTPDFCIGYADGHIEFHEVKGTKGAWPYYREGAKDRIKIAAGIYGALADFVVVWQVRGEGWKKENF